MLGKWYPFLCSKKQSILVWNPTLDLFSFFLTSTAPFIPWLGNIVPIREITARSIFTRFWPLQSALSGRRILLLSTSSIRRFHAAGTMSWQHIRHQLALAWRCDASTPCIYFVYCEIKVQSTSGSRPLEIPIEGSNTRDGVYRFASGSTALIYFESSF